MKLIIAGSRTFSTQKAYSEIMKLRPKLTGITEVVSGGCRGVDEAGEAYAKTCGVPIKNFPADWKKHGRAAGPIRNKEMARYADALLLIWDGKSKGSKNMKIEMLLSRKKVHEIVLT